jgi:hypothetical protein
MLAGGMFAAVPSMVPAAHAANANLFVSAENSQFDNYMSGPQVIEVVVIDSDINDTDEAKGEPDVTVNGKILRMVQAVDGNWYGYFADRNMASIADSTVTSSSLFDQGLDFGTLCATGSGTNTAVGVTVDDTVGIALPTSNAGGQNGTSTGGPLTAACSAPGTGTNGTINVVREAKTPNTTLTGDQIGQIGISSVNVWPFIQLYSLNPTGNVIVQYNKGGGAQTTTLTFDTVDQFAGVSLDKAKYTQSAQVHATITDLWLNIDPTDEDSWTFGTNVNNATSKGTYYQVFDENGNAAGSNVTGGSINIDSTLDNLMCEDNCRLLVNVNKQSSANSVLTIQDNDDSIIASATSDANNATSFAVGAAAPSVLGAGSVPVTITEQGPNSGIFGTYDESDTSVLKITSNAARGTSATVDYNETPVTILVGFDFATVDIQPTDAEWTSGEEIPVVIVDGDANRNSRADEDLDVNNPDTALIPALTTGDPFTFGELSIGVNSTQVVHINGTTGGFFTNGNLTTINALTTNVTNSVAIQKFSQRGILTATDTTSLINGTVIDFNTTFEELSKSIRDNDNTGVGAFHGFNFLNLDVRSIVSSGTVDVYLLNGTDIINTSGLVASNTINGVLIADDVSPQSLSSLNGTINDRIFESGLAASTQVGLLIDYNRATFAVNANEAIVADFFSYGFLNDGLEQNERIANQIIRIEAEETGDNTGTFEGSLEFIMVNQLNILDEDTYLDLAPIDSAPTFIVIEDLDDEESPRVNYNDLGADGVTTQVADQQAAGSHSGVVSLDASSYKTADTVKVTLEDLDLNVDSDLVDIYTTVTDFGTLYDVVGNNSTSITLSNGDELGRLLDITFDDQKWTSPVSGSECDTDLDNAGVTDTGLGATGFTLVETGAETGIFTGDFQIPAQW